MKIQEQIKTIINESLGKLGIEAGDFVLEHPADLKMGDYSTNIALSVAKNLKTNPKDLAIKIANEINKNLPPEISKVETAGPGFVNFYLSEKFFNESIKEILEKSENYGRGDLYAGQKRRGEYTDPNPFKEFHIGHLMSNAICEAIS